MDGGKLAYLEAMGIDVWVPRREAGADGLRGPEGTEITPRITLATGEGDILCVARTVEETRSKLAGDIGRAMRVAPVWAWHGGDESNSGEQPVPLRAALAEHLFTRVLVFGREVAEALFNAEIPETIAAARIHVVPGLERLGRDREAKRILWSVMCEQGIANSQAGGRATS